jgi:hypothetical protein
MALGDFGVIVSPNTVARLLHCQRSSLIVVFWTSPEASTLIRAEGASHRSDH